MMGLYEAMRDKAAATLGSLSVFFWLPYYRIKAPLDKFTHILAQISQTGVILPNIPPSWNIQNNQIDCHKWQIILLLLKDCHPWNVFIAISSLSLSDYSSKQAIPPVINW